MTHLSASAFFLHTIIFSLPISSHPVFLFEYIIISCEPFCNLFSQPCFILRPLSTIITMLTFKFMYNLSIIHSQASPCSPFTMSLFSVSKSSNFIIHLFNSFHLYETPVITSYTTFLAGKYQTYLYLFA